MFEIVRWPPGGDGTFRSRRARPSECCLLSLVVPRELWLSGHSRSGGFAVPISIRVESREVQRQLKRLSNGDFKKVMRRAVNRTVRSARAEASRQIRSEVKLRARDLKRYLKVKAARGSDGVAFLRIEGKPVPLILYGGRERRVKGRRGASVAVRGRRKIVRGGFIATTKSGHRGIFRRKKGAGRLPIEELQGPAPVQVIDDEKRIRLVRFARDRLTTEAQQQVNFLLISRAG